jgi:hypothetical protein
MDCDLRARALSLRRLNVGRPGLLRESGSRSSRSPSLNGLLSAHQPGRQPFLFSGRRRSSPHAGAAPNHTNHLRFSRAGAGSETKEWSTHRRLP